MAVCTLLICLSFLLCPQSLECNELSMTEKENKNTLFLLLEQNFLFSSGALTKLCLYIPAHKTEDSFHSIRSETDLSEKIMLIQRQKREIESLKHDVYVRNLLIFLILPGSLLGYFFMERRHYRQKLKYLEQITRFRISNIRNRISPHFMLNILNQEISRADKETKNHLLTFAHLLRRCLGMEEQINIKLGDEIDFVKDYIELEKQKFGEDFTIK